MGTCCISINYDMYIHHIHIYIYLYDLMVGALNCFHIGLIKLT